MDNVFEIDYSDLVASGISFDEINIAFGKDGLGILLVSNVPNLEEMRHQALPLARRFAVLPDNVKSKYEHAESYYSFGWSHGREKMQKGVPDTMKGSYYFNPEHDKPFDDDTTQKWPLFCHPNIWPNEEIPEFRDTLMQLSMLITDTARYVLKSCDEYVSRHYPSHQERSFLTTVGDSRVNKARLLHYFPQTGSLDSSGSTSWCGIHNDHGFLTGLVSAIYLDEYGKIVDPASLPDQECGLYIRRRNGEYVHVKIPSNAIAFQIGESACICSGGLLQPTPHFVKAPVCDNARFSRETMAVFMSAKWDYPLTCPPETNESYIFQASTREHLPDEVPNLSSRWDDGITYQEFSERTFAAYYA